MQHRKAIFLDRDGVINREKGRYVYEIADFDLNRHLTQWLRYWQARDFLLIVITNQGGIAKQLYTHQHVELLHNHLIKILSEQGITLSAIYYCPHHHSVSRCLCRKPQPLMLEKAIARFGINPQQSYMIGDSPRDIQAAEAAGVTGVKIESNQLNMLKNSMFDN